MKLNSSNIHLFVAAIAAATLPTSAIAQTPVNVFLEENKLAIAVLVFLYFLPGWIAWSRKHHNRGPIILLNVLAGWTGIFWLVALFWSISAIRKNETIVIHSPTPTTSAVPIVQNPSVTVPVANKTIAERIADLKAMLDSGTISEAEFNLLKQDAMKGMG